MVRVPGPAADAACDGCGHEGHERHGPHGGGGHRHQGHREGERREPHTLHPHAQARRERIPGAECVHSGREHRAHGQQHEQAEPHLRDVLPRGGIERTGEPLHRVLRGVDVCTGEHAVDGRPGEGAPGHTGEHELADAGARAPSGEDDREHETEATRERADRHRSSGETRGDRDHRAEPRTGGDAHDVRGGQRVAQHALEQVARESEGGAREDSQDRAGQGDLPHDVVRGPVVVVGQHREQVRNRHHVLAERDPDEGRHGQDEQQQEGDPPGAATRASASRADGVDRLRTGRQLQCRAHAATVFPRSTATRAGAPITTRAIPTWISRSGTSTRATTSASSTMAGPASRHAGITRR